MGWHVLGSCCPITLGVTQEWQLGEVKAGESLALAGELGFLGSCSRLPGSFGECGVAISLQSNPFSLAQSQVVVVARWDQWQLPQGW